LEDVNADAILFRLLGWVQLQEEKNHYLASRNHLTHSGQWHDDNG
jgi:hypothetical protein